MLIFNVMLKPGKQIEFSRNLIEKSAFGVCQDIADRIGIRASRVRMYFIYASFIAMGSPLIIYLGLAFIKNLKKYIYSSPQEAVWD